MRLSQPESWLMNGKGEIMDNISKSYKTWIDIDCSSINHNYFSFRKLLKSETKLMAVVKSNAYGHDLIKFSKEVDKLGVDFFGVDEAREAFELQKAGIKKPILILGYIEEDLLEKVIKNRVSFIVSNFEVLNRVINLKNLNPKIHIDVDTGLGRLGFLEKDINNLLEIIKKENLPIEGICTHYSYAESPSHIDYTNMQTKIFEKWVSVFHENGFNPIRHASAASGCILGQEYHFDMVRIGIGLFGHYGSQEIRDWSKDKISLKQVMTWKTIIVEVKEKSKGSFLGYDLKKCLDRDSVIAIIPVGYWHGLTGIMTNNGEVLVKGKRAPIFGRVSMDMTIIDVTDISDVKIGEEVVLVGHQGDDCISTDELKYRLEMINYEFVTRINPQIPRLYK